MLKLKRMIERYMTPPERYQTVEINGHRLLIDTYDKWMKDNYLWCDIYEPETTKYIEETLGPNDIALDIGAHIGYQTLNMARTGAYVFAFEPDPQSWALFKKNTKSLSNVCLIKKAVTDYTGKITFYKNRYRSAWSSLTLQRDTIPETVRCMKLDDGLFYDVKIIKIDTEGTELKVLQGMEWHMKHSPDLKLIIEWLPKNDGDLEGILKFLKGWKCKPLDHNMLFWKESYCSVCGLPFQNYCSKCKSYHCPPEKCDSDFALVCKGD